jgi:large subunit ribosomal protein L24
MKRIKKGDEVIVTTGKSKGHVGTVLQVYDATLTVSGANLVTKHKKPNPQKPEEKTGIITLEAPLHISNVAHYNPETKKADKIGFQYIENDNALKEKFRYYKSTKNKIIDRA